MAESLLHRALQLRDACEVERLLARGGAAVAGASALGSAAKTTPLHAACRAGDSHLELTRLLLRRGASCDVAEIASVGGRTPLHLAAQARSPDCVAALLEAGANPVAQDPRGQTPLHVAAQEGCHGTTVLLLDHGADPHGCDAAGFNAAWWAQEFQHPALVALYAARGVAPRAMSHRHVVEHSGLAGPKLKHIRRMDDWGRARSAPRRRAQAKVKAAAAPARPRSLGRTAQSARGR
ncbi:unnamed protein product [Prorocentrum cordatum]|uniref:Uncharacterized protein n=1 Tax=Prorocentrum cordatum TaxID=2364126 RepID=A0ABN9QTQ6_9DINO|nr:unnamed protein product [Polarella glacialis]